MRDPMVFTKRGPVPPDAVYVGRPSKWGNPFAMGRDGSRSEVIVKYETYLLESPLVDEIEELRGCDLVCWCAPLACHADVLLRLANTDPEGNSDERAI